MNSELLKLEGYAEALKREQTARDVGILNVNSHFRGFEVRQITLRDWLILDAIDSPILRGEIPQPEEVARFLWVLSPRFVAGRGLFARWSRFRFVRKVAKLPYGEASVFCVNHVKDSFMEPPMQTASKNQEWIAPQVSFAASLIHTISHFYGWTRSDVLAMPVKELFQYMKLIRIHNEASSGQNPIYANPSDEVRLKAIIKIRKERQAEKAKNQ